MLRAAATMALRTELLAGELASGSDVPADELIRSTATLTRLLTRLGLASGGSDPDPATPSLSGDRAADQARRSAEAHAEGDAAEMARIYAEMLVPDSETNPSGSGLKSPAMMLAAIMEKQLASLTPDELAAVYHRAVHNSREPTDA